ncbi:hypothetical protein JCM11251_003056 [Rhodosporidiobolus azoricus]
MGRPEDAQPSEAISSNRRPTAPPELVPLGQYQQRAQQAQAERERERERSRQQQQQGQAGRAGGWANAPARGGTNGRERGGAGRGRGGTPFINPVRLNRGKSNTAGSWADVPTGPRTDRNGKGKEREVEGGGYDSSAGGSGAESGGGGMGGYLSFLAAKGQSYATPIAVPQNPRATLYVKGLPGGVTEDQVRSVFEKYGAIERVSVNNQSPTYAYAHVVYTHPTFASAALFALNMEPFPLPVASTSASSSASASSSTAGVISQTREMHIQYSEPDPSRRVSGGSGTAIAAFPASSNWLEGGGVGYEETNAALFRARETPIPSQQSGSGNEAIKAEQEPSPVKPPNHHPLPARPASDLSFSAAQPSSRAPPAPSLPSVPDAPPLRTASGQAVHASSISPCGGPASSNYTALYPLPPEYYPTTKHSAFGQAVRVNLREDRPDVTVHRHGFEGNTYRLDFTVKPTQGGAGKQDARVVQASLRADEEAAVRGGFEEPKWMSKTARRNKRKREQKAQLEREKREKKATESGERQVGANGGLVVEEQEDEGDADAMDTSDGEGEDDDEVDELDEEDDGDAAVEQLLRPSSRPATVDPLPPPPTSAAPSAAAATSASSVFPSSHTSAPRFPALVAASVPNALSATAAAPSAPAPAPSAGLLDDGTQYERVPLPSEAVADPAAKTRFLVEQVKRLHGEGKVVLSNSTDGDFLVLHYFLDESSAPSPDRASATSPAAQPNVASTSSTLATAQQPAAPPLSRTVTTSTAQQRLADLHLPSYGSDSPAAVPATTTDVDVEMEDIKPVIPLSPVRQVSGVRNREETDQLATPAPSEPPTRFPMKMQGSSNVDRKDTFTIVSPFLNLYFQRFDSSRASLESMYTSDASFSLRISSAVPPRARSPPIPFSKKWLVAAQKSCSITPVSITNAIRELPAGSTDLDKIIFTARAVPELGGAVHGAGGGTGGKKRATYPPIVLHLTGEFEEFPEKVVRRFARTFLLVPKSPRFGTGTEGPEYWIRSDQLTVLYKVEGEPRPLPLQDKLFEAAPKKQGVVSSGLNALSGGGMVPPVVGSASLDVPSSAFNPLANFAFGGQGAQFQPHASTSRQQQQQQPPLPSAARPAPPPAARRPSITTSNPAALDPANAPQVAPPPPASAALARIPSSDCIILSDSDSVTSASRSPELTRRLAPAPAPIFPSPQQAPRQRQPPSSSKSLGKRRATHMDDSDSATGAQGSSPAVARAAQRQRTASSTTSSSAATAAAAAEQAEADRLGVSTDTLREMVQREVAAQVAKLTGGAGTTATSGGSGKGKKGDGLADKGKGGKGTAKGKEKVVEKEKGGKDGATGKVTKGKGAKEKGQDAPLGTGLGQSDGRIVVTSGASSQLHTFDGRANKLRHMVRVSPSSFLAISFLGDIAEFSLSPDTSLASTRILHKNTGDDRFRVEEAAWSDSKETLVVGYLGTKESGVKELRQPPSQVVLYKREEHPHTGNAYLHETTVAHKPHAHGGVTAVTALSGGGRLRFVTAGEDKKLFLWTRQRSTQALTTEDIRSQHSSTITSLAHLPEHNYIVSASKDKRVFAHDLSHQSSVWQALLPHPVMTVQTLTVDPNLILARMGSPANQFSIHDVRQSSTAAPVLSFGIDLQPHRHNTSGALAPTNMGRYLRGEMCDSIFAFPDHEYGVKLWDLRNVRSAALNPSSFKRQHLANLGSSKVVQAAFAGRDQLCLMELNHFTRVGIRG